MLPISMLSVHFLLCSEVQKSHRKIRIKGLLEDGLTFNFTLSWEEGLRQSTSLLRSPRTGLIHPLKIMKIIKPEGLILDTVQYSSELNRQGRVKTRVIRSANKTTFKLHSVYLQYKILTTMQLKSKSKNLTAERDAISNVPQVRDNKMSTNITVRCDGNTVRR